MDRQIFDLVNQVRQRPQDMIPHLQQMEQRFDGMMYKQQGKTTVRTKEGVQAVREAIQFLRDLRAVRPLGWHNELAQCARNHCQDTGAKGLVQHEGSDGTPVKERLKRFGKIVTGYGENLTYHCDNAMEVILQSIVDDGVPNRGHRENLFNPEFRVMGCHSGVHKDFDSMTVIDFCAAFIRNGDEDPIEWQMDSFLKEEVEFPEMPADVRGWKQNSKITVQGHRATKTVERVCRLRDGREERFVKNLEREFDL
jgi:uncharacterized protein YkwD